MHKKYIEDDIQSLSVSDAVRLRPQLYFQKCFEENTLDSLPFEVACHAFDEYYDGNCNSLKIKLSENAFSIHYNAGMSLEYGVHDKPLAELIMTQIFACRNEKKHLAVGDEFCNLGIATINYAAEVCELTTISKNTKGVFLLKKEKHYIELSKKQVKTKPPLFL